MKKPINEIKKMQRLAGLITESEYQESLLNEAQSSFSILSQYNVSPQDIQEVNDIVEDSKSVYKNLDSTKFPNKGIDAVINNPQFNDEIAEKIASFYEEDPNMGIDELHLLAGDLTDLHVMRKFAPQLIQNFLDAGFTYDKNTDVWTDPNDPNEVLESYDILSKYWDVSTDIDENIGDIFREEAEEF